MKNHIICWRCLSDDWVECDTIGEAASVRHVDALWSLLRTLSSVFALLLPRVTASSAQVRSAAPCSCCLWGWLVQWWGPGSHAHTHTHTLKGLSSRLGRRPALCPGCWVLQPDGVLLHCMRPRLHLGSDWACKITEPPHSPPPPWGFLCPHPPCWLSPLPELTLALQLLSTLWLWG